ncbi:MAG: LCP family protein [Lachnospiraceae bacterium]|nr:LCP family protein [Lachnospiraceae bacterium]
MATQETKQENNTMKKVGISMCVITLLCFAFLGLMIFKLNMLPFKLLLIMIVVMGIVMVLDIILLCGNLGKGAFGVGVFLSLLCIIVSAIGGVYIIKTTKALKGITSAGKETAKISVFVLNDSGIDDISVLDGANFGIEGTMDRVNTDDAVNKIMNDKSIQINALSYEGLDSLADALRNGEVNAIILNEGYLDVYRDSQGYESFPDEIKVISCEEIVSEVDESEKKDIDFDNEYFAVYVSGIDTDGPVSCKSRSDVNIIAYVNIKSKQILLVSTPRDYFIPLSISDGNRDKLTHAGIYGVDVSMDTLGMLYDEKIEHYFRLNFTGFKTIIDELGGINVVSDYDFSTPNYSYTAGENFLYGEAALEFARERYSFEDGDNQRGKNQMKVITAVISKATSPAILKNYSSILKSLDGTFETSLSYDSISKLVKMQLDKGGSWEISSYSVTGFDSSSTTYSINQNLYVMEPDYTSVETAKKLIDQLKRGEKVEVPEQ